MEPGLDAPTGIDDCLEGRRPLDDADDDLIVELRPGGDCLGRGSRGTRRDSIPSTDLLLIGRLPSASAGPSPPVPDLRIGLGRDEPRPFSLDPRL